MLYSKRLSSCIPSCLCVLLLCFANRLSAADLIVENKKIADHYVVKETFDVGKNVFVRSLAYDEVSDSLWVGTSVGALQVNAHSVEVIKTLTRENGLANEYVFASYIGLNSDVWFGTNGGGVSRLTSGGWKTYFPMHGLADYWVYSFVEEPGKSMWIGTWAGLSRFDYKSQQFTTYIKELVNEWVYGLAVDLKGRLWVGTEGGVNMYDGSAWLVWTHADGLGAKNEKNLAFSTNTGLGTRTRHDLSILQNGLETFNPNYVFCIKVAPDGGIWAGTWGGGVSYFTDDKQWRNLTEANGLAGNIVYSIEIIKGNEYWFGTNKGLSHFDGNVWQTIGVEQGLLDSHIYAIARDSIGRVWVGTRNGVALIEKIP